MVKVASVVTHRRPADTSAAVRELILAGGDVLRFYDPDRPYLDRRDVEIALDIDRYDFAIWVGVEGGLLVARQER